MSKFSTCIKNQLPFNYWGFGSHRLFGICNPAPLGVVGFLIRHIGCSSFFEKTDYKSFDLSFRIANPKKQRVLVTNLIKHTTLLLLITTSLALNQVNGQFKTVEKQKLYIPKFGFDVDSIPQDLFTPAISIGSPKPGKRVRQINEGFDNTEIYHTIYLPIDWKQGEKYPVIMEYAGNKWKSSPGTVEGSNLGFGISGGKGVIWICLPFVDIKNKKNALNWWGDVEATVEYCKKTVNRVCSEYGGDPSAVFLAGFSRGAIACNFIGLYDDEIASLWRGMICHSHYDGVRKWSFDGSDQKSALARLARLGNMPQFISHENNNFDKALSSTRQYLKNAFPKGQFTFHLTGFKNHTDTWVLRNIEDRKIIRNWFKDILNNN